ncbi:MAG: hypothetical protein ACPGVU_07925 [Limisphaerales bacterium]
MPELFGVDGLELVGEGAETLELLLVEAGGFGLSPAFFSAMTAPKPPPINTAVPRMDKAIAVGFMPAPDLAGAGVGPPEFPGTTTAALQAGQITWQPTNFASALIGCLQLVQEKVTSLMGLKGILE